VTQVDITKIDREFFGVSGLLSEFVNIVGHDFYHPHTIFMDVIWMSSSACQVCASTAALPDEHALDEAMPFCIARFSRELKSKTALATGPGPD
jgi:hypothetical protein